MTNKETVERNIGLTFDFVHYLMDHPEEVETLPDNFELEFIEKDFPLREKKYLLSSGDKISRKYVMVKNTFELTKQDWPETGEPLTEYRTPTTDPSAPLRDHN